MQLIPKKRVWRLFWGICLVSLLVFGIVQLYPSLLFYVVEWQKSFNQSISGSLHAIEENRTQAGWILLGVSFLYGVFHAVGPGHGKFILSSYLSFEQTQLSQAMRITLLSAFAQGIVAIVVVSIVVVILTLSRSYFNQTLRWIELAGLILMIFFGLFWCLQAVKNAKVLQKYRAQSGLKINRIRQIDDTPHIHSENCGCGHQHLPSSGQLKQAQNGKMQWMLILSIGSRPCSGAILVLFLAYTLDLFGWGVLATLAMSFGTGLTLSLFAFLVMKARQKAVRLSGWYLSQRTNQRLALGLKLIAGIGLMIFAGLLLHGSFFNDVPAVFFKR